MSEQGADGGTRRLTDEELLQAAPTGIRGEEARVGLFVIVGLVSFIVVLFLMTDPATFRGRYTLVTSVDNAGGVRPGDPVQMSGVNLGRVHGFEMVSLNRVDITLELEGEFEIPVGSVVTFGEAGLFGGRTIVIEASDANEYYASGDTIPGEGASTGGLLGSVDQLSEQAGDVLASIQEMLNDETVESIQGAAGGAETMVEEFTTLASDLRGPATDLTESLGRAAENIEAAAAEAGPNVASASARADSTLAQLRETSAAVDSAMVSLSSILARVEAGDGTLGRLTADDAELYENLNAATASLEALLEDLRENPNRYINLSIF